MDLIFYCPHCNDKLIINTNDLNCKIFRHGQYKDGRPLDPHAPKVLCDSVVKSDLVYGCAKPFQIIKNEGNYTIKICDYI